eukprot:142244-Pelagomonas_calceolata.AAC.2
MKTGYPSRTPSPKLGLRPQRSSTATSVAIFQGLSSSHPPCILLGVGGVIFTSHTLEPLSKLGLDIPRATKLALKLHAHPVQYANKLADFPVTNFAWKTNGIRETSAHTSLEFATNLLREALASLLVRGPSLNACSWTWLA